MKIELEKNLNSDLNRFFKMLNKYSEEFNNIQDLFNYILDRMLKDKFECNQTFKFSNNNNSIMFTFQKLEHINNITINYMINVIIDEETLKIVGVTKSETRQYNEIIF